MAKKSLKSQLNGLQLPSAAEWMEMISEVSKKNLRKAYRISKAYLLATCETVGICCEDKKYSSSLKKATRKDFTYESFLKIVYETIPSYLERIEEGEKLENIIQEAAEKYGDKILEIVDTE